MRIEGLKIFNGGQKYFWHYLQYQCEFSNKNWLLLSFSARVFDAETSHSDMNIWVLPSFLYSVVMWVWTFIKYQLL